ncbi:LysR substrate-binding domain-containing protein [Diaphorobacter sp. HDW4B]|uniref:LysR substrate-binding domain-containing protein n=1 Tax=Diaphorobacter sp. HDW4B TaxID=2714925 RepID=UPI00352CB560
MSPRSRVSTLSSAAIFCTSRKASWDSIRRSVDAAAKAANVRLNAQYEVQQMQTLIVMAAQGLGIGIAPRIAAGAAVQ